LMEGVSSEAASLAGHLGLGKLIVLYDDNSITIDGSTDISFTEDVAARFEAYGWHTKHLDDGNDLVAIDEAIDEAKQERNRPSILLIKTHIGYGSPNKQDTSSAHGSPLGDSEIALTKRQYNWPEDARFLVPERARLHMDATERGRELEATWRAQIDDWAMWHPDDAAELERRLSGALPEGWHADLPRFEPDPKGMATRSASGKVLAAMHETLPELFGGSADLAGSN